MEIVYQENTAPAIDVREVIRRIGPTKGELKAIESARSRRGELADLAASYGTRQSIVAAVAEAQASFVANPCHETAAKLREVASFHVDDIEKAFRDISNQLRATVSAELTAAALSWFDRAAGEVSAQLDATQSALDAAPHLAGESVNFKRRAKATRDHIIAMREQAAADPLGWIEWEISTV